MTRKWGGNKKNIDSDIVNEELANMCAGLFDWVFKSQSAQQK